jgi:PAS domain S-box-containing protein
MRNREAVAESNGWPRAVVVATATSAILGGLVTLAGWATDTPRLTDWKNDGISMFPNPSLCALLCGVLLLAIDRSGRRWALLTRPLSCVVLLIGGLTLCEHVARVDLGIDRLLFDRPWGQAAAAAPMRMGPPASISFLLLGTALLLSSFDGRARGVGVGLALTVAAIAMLSLVGHLYGAQQMYTLPLVTAIAMQTASIILALAVGTIASARDREPMRTLLAPGSAGMLARRALPPIVVVALGLGWVRVLAQNHGWVDTAFGTASRTILEILFLLGLLWSAVRKIHAHEQALRESATEIRHQAKQLAAFLDTAAIALHRVGHDGAILWANEAELEMLGYAREEYVGHPIAEFHVDQAAIADLLARLHRGEKVGEQESRMRCKDGSVKTVLIDSSVLWDEGRFVHTQCFTRDVTDKKRAETEREEANRRKDEFMAILGHELRNPLGPVRNAAHYLKLKGSSDPDSRRAVEMIERQVATMARLIDDLLDVSRLSRGSLELRRSRVPLLQIVEQAVDACRGDVDAKRHRLRMTLPAGPVEVDADRERLVQVLCNLIGNSAKYTPLGGEIDVAIAVNGHGIEVTVKDNGIGIPKGSLTKIFELFARVDGSLEGQGGLGVGLNLVRQIVDLHGGTIEARSDGIGLGSEFVLRLPIVSSPGTTVARVPEKPSVGPPCRILVADDNPDAVETLKLILEAAGHDVHTALDGEAALRLAEEIRPRLALLDIGMPRMNGYEVARRIRASPWGRPIHLVALTGWGQESDKQRGKEVGFDAHFVKPVAPEALQRLIATIRGQPMSKSTT